MTFLAKEARRNVIVVLWTDFFYSAGNPVYCSPVIQNHSFITSCTRLLMHLFKMDFKLVFAFLVCLTNKVSGQLPIAGLPLPGNLPISQNIGTLPAIGTSGNVVPPTQSMAFTAANQPATSPPWMASAQSGGNIPTVPTVPPSTTSVVTFLSVSGSFPSVSIPDNGYDDHYVTIKSMFDTYYPNVPPLRRVENRATLQIFQGSTIRCIFGKQ